MGHITKISCFLSARRRVWLPSSTVQSSPLQGMPIPSSPCELRPGEKQKSVTKNLDFLL